MIEVGIYKEVHKSKIKANTWNPNVMTDEELNRLKKSMDRNGMLQTVLLYEEKEDDYMIIDGEHRWRTAGDDENIRAIVINDMDIEVIKDNLKDREGLVIEDRDDVLKHLTVIMNKLRGNATPTKLGELLESLSIEETNKANLMLMDEQEIQFYSLVEEIEDEKRSIHEKEFNQDKAEFIKWKVKDVTGLKSVSLDIKNSEFYVDGDKKELETLTMTVNKKLKAVVNCRYRDIKKDEPEESDVSGTVGGIEEEGSEPSTETEQV